MGTVSVDHERLRDCATGSRDLGAAVAYRTVHLTQALDGFRRGSDQSLLPQPLPNVSELAAQLARELDAFANRWADVATAVKRADTDPAAGPVTVDEALVRSHLTPRAGGRPWPFDPTDPADTPPAIEWRWFNGYVPGGQVPGDWSTYSKEYWQQKAYERAGVDPSQWRPGLDFTANDQASRDIWEAYGSYWLLDPKKFAWAGLAKFAGATIYGGWMDLMAAVQHLDGAERVKQLTDLLRRGFNLPPVPAMELAEELSQFSTDELQQVMRQRMQPMQRAIFEDLAWQHEAYATGGLPAIEALASTGQLDQSMLGAWRSIDRGDPENVRRGTAQMVNQEQFVILQPWYNELLRDPEFGRLFTTMMSATASSPVPGGRAFRDVVSLPQGNVASRVDREKWINEAISPEFEQYVLDHPDEMRALMQPDNLESLGHERRLAPWLPYRR